MAENKKDWQQIVSEKRAKRQSRLPPKWLVPDDELPAEGTLDVTSLCKDKGWLSTEELDITAKTVTALTSIIAAGQVSAVDVVSAFVHRATIAQQLLNPLTEINFEDALAEAERLDKHLKETGQVVGPLHGVPFSVKDQFDVKGLDTTMGYCAWEGRIGGQDWGLVAASGAVVLTKTNVGHTLMFTETINTLWGRTVNPYNRGLTTGSSSGGEGALIAFHGSPLGFGTDIGGSIRVVAAFCGLYSLRPSHGRISMRGVADPLEGQEAVRSTAGPFAHCPEDLDLVMKVYMASEPWRTDPAILRMPWANTVTTSDPERKYCFAIAYGDELVTPHPPTLRGLKHTVALLKAAGHTVVEWKGPFRSETTDKLMEIFWCADGGASIRKDLEASGEPIYSDTMGMINSKGSTVYETWQAQHERTKHVEWWHDIWEAACEYSGTGQPIDGLISALCPYTAWPHRVDVDKDIPIYEHGYCAEQPLLDLASGTFPTGLFQDPEIDLPKQNFNPRSESDIKENARYSNPEEWRNGPIGLQLSARRLEEEKVVSMLCKIRDALEK